jgi:hypothetical protein
MLGSHTIPPESAALGRAVRSKDFHSKLSIVVLGNRLEKIRGP